MRHILITIIFHPKSSAGEEIASALYDGLNEDRLVPSLSVPTLFAPLCGDAPPPLPELDGAKRNLVVLLADEEFAVDDDWCSYAAALRARCVERGEAFFPVQLHEHAYPLHDDLDGVNFLRAWSDGDPARLILRRILVELCRILEGESFDIENPTAPIKLFLSHAKGDAYHEDSAFSSLVGYLNRSQPVQAWVDSADISTNSRFAEEIEKGVERSSLLCILTDSYASRRWCRREILMAKQHQRPIVVVRDVTDHEVRSFAYGGNVPDLQWKGVPEDAIDLLLKETLRMLLAKEALSASGAPYDELLLSPPELVTVVGRAQGLRLLYPDPPIGCDEKELLAAIGTDLSTPLEQFLKDRSLTGMPVAVSHSQSTDIRAFGMRPKHLESAALSVARYLLVQGAVLVYGGHLGSQSFTNQLLDLVVTHNAQDGVPHFERIVNYLGWPIPRPDADARLRLKSGMTLVETPRPADVTSELGGNFVDEPDFFRFEWSPVHRFAWARGMTEMRRQQTAAVSARVVVGGPFGPTLQPQADGTFAERWSAGRIPGVLEEILLSLQADQPVFLLGGFGGAAKLAADLAKGLTRHECSWAYQSRAPHSEAMRALYKERDIDWIGYDEICGRLKSRGLAGLNPLNEAQNQILADSNHPETIIPLVLEGLAKTSA